MNDCNCKTLTVLPECWKNPEQPPPIAPVYVSRKDEIWRGVIKAKRIRENLPPLSPEELEAEVKEQLEKHDKPKQQNEPISLPDTCFTDVTMPKNTVPADIKPAAFARTLDELKRPLMNDAQEV